MPPERVGGVCATHRKADAPPVDSALGGKILSALEKIDWAQLNAERRLAWLRGSVTSGQVSAWSDSVATWTVLLGYRELQPEAHAAARAPQSA